jgi:hypothetical protein
LFQKVQEEAQRNGREMWPAVANTRFIHLRVLEGNPAPGGPGPGWAVDHVGIFADPRIAQEDCLGKQFFW